MPTEYDIRDWSESAASEFYSNRPQYRTKKQLIEIIKFWIETAIKATEQGM